MEFVKAMKIKKRICLNLNCHSCPLGKDNNGKGLVCDNFMKRHPEEAEKILEQWDKEHPQKSYKDVLADKLPNAEIAELIDLYCPKMFFGGNAPNNKTCGKTGECFSECWNQPYEEE